MSGLGRKEFNITHGYLAALNHAGQRVHIGPALLSEFGHPVRELDGGVNNPWLAKAIVAYCQRRDLPTHWRFVAEQPHGDSYLQVWWPAAAPREPPR